MIMSLLAILASLLTGLVSVIIFIFVFKQDYFRNIEESRYQVIWSDVEELLVSTREESRNN
ncbi:MAG: hypothetical protein RIR86_1566 [Acidobacteriota bacterium]|jgi:hypothetical protein